MKQQLLATLAVSLLVTLFLSGVSLAEPVVDVALSHYPGAVRLEGENFDTSRLSRGWLTRQAIYQSADDWYDVVLWYTARLPQAEMHESATCVTLRQTWDFLVLQRVDYVLLYRLAPGTRIVLMEDLVVSR